MKKITLILSLLIPFIIGAQEYDIRFKLSSIDCENEMVCYDVQLRANGSSWNLAGQNYRIYYNSELAGYESGSSLLPQPTYGNYTLVQDVQNADASSVNGSLSFESDLGFLNYFIDLNDVMMGALEIGGEWLTTSNLCFSVNSSVFDNDNECIELIWARSGLTDEYATAFVEVSEWIGFNNTGSTTGSEYDDLDSSDGENSCLNESCDLPDYTVLDISVDEDAGVATIEICLDSVNLNSDVTFTYSTADNSASVPFDYNSESNETLTIPSGDLCADIEINIEDDDVAENTETFFVNISDVIGANLSDDQVEVTILDDDPACQAEAPMIIIE